MPNYFELRNVPVETFAGYTIPGWLSAELAGIGRETRILDFGCGWGQLITALKQSGFGSAAGADIEPAALAHCRDKGHVVYDLRSPDEFYDGLRGTFDLIVSMHVLEHIPKADVITELRRLRELLTPSGRLVVAVPNAQSFTGPYWAYEDFTHQTLYTTGSISFVLRAAGFREVRFLDVQCTAGIGPIARLCRRVTWRLYDAWYRSMCRLMASWTHIGSPNIYSYEIKVVATA
jgi:SAM-dependent methyltransferase